MGALPKKKRPRSMQRSRWSHSAHKPLTLSSCPHCSSMKLPHRVCPECGYYAGKEVVSTRVAEETPEES